VTFAPSAVKIDACSQPIAPPPTITTLAGVEPISSTRSESKTTWRSGRSVAVPATSSTWWRATFSLTAWLIDPLTSSVRWLSWLWIADGSSCTDTP